MEQHKITANSAAVRGRKKLLQTQPQIAAEPTENCCRRSKKTNAVELGSWAVEICPTMCRSTEHCRQQKTAAERAKNNRRKSKNLLRRKKTAAEASKSADGAAKNFCRTCKKTAALTMGSSVIKPHCRSEGPQEGSCGVFGRCSILPTLLWSI